MCILFLLVGDQNRPTLICSNRDEYYNRRTVRGDFDTEGFQYSPLDVEGGGTWLSAAGLDQSADDFRYAVVLNFHHWRESHPFRSTGEKQLTHTSPNLKSRGLLIKNFMDDLSCSALTYANIMYKDRALYRPFNLVVSDRSGTYYVSSSKQQKGRPERLQAGRLYGISNGYMHDSWEKTTTGRLLVGKALIKDYRLFAHADSVKGRMPSKVDTEEFVLIEEPSQEIKFVMLKLMQVMKNDKPLNDPTFGAESASAMQLTSIFVQPTLILRQAFEQRISIVLYIVKAIIRIVKEILQYCISLLVLANVETPTVLSNLCCADWYERVALFLHTAKVLGLFQQPSPDRTSGPFAHNDLFGTRTITLIYHMPKTAPITSHSNFRHQPPSAHQTPREHKLPGDELCSDFCIMEKDLNTVSMVWSTNEFSNMQ